MTNVLQFKEPRAFFSRNTPERLQIILDKALSSDDLCEKESSLLNARNKWPGEPDSHISLYKFYFVDAQYNKAEAAVWAALRQASGIAGFNRNYRRLNSQSADWSKHEGAERFYLFSLKALGVCRLRRGRVLAAYSVLKKLCELDEYDEIGGSAYFKIASSFFNDD